ILNNKIYFEEVTVLDLFAGIGSITLEFISRGSTRVTAVEKHPECVTFLLNTIHELALDDKEGFAVVRADVMSYLAKAFNKNDIIFADPPYEYEHYDEVIRLVFDRELLSEGGMLIVEHDQRRSFDQHPYFQEMRRYGGVAFSFFSVGEDAD
ncbi:MAG: RsmD family RNA methyltransferase, partial [Cryomorphaceae bacterium]|nr:RsmD family RNA methyltransferase [Cryomorphaceae bacterium]